MTDRLSSGPISSSEELEASNDDVEKLKELDNLLKCSICYDYFSTCVITDCSHNFCSLCIRKSIQFKTECPLCFSPLYDNQLRANRIVESFLAILPTLKDRLVRHLRTLKVLSKNEVYSISPVKKVNLETPNGATCTNAVKFSTPGSPDSRQASTSSQSKVVIPKMFQSPKKVVTTSENSTTSQKHVVSCPVCSVEVPERNINLHLDKCLSRDMDKRKDDTEPPRRKNLPKLVYRLMNICNLRAKAKEYGISSNGDFETLKNRLQRYTALHNAECDKSNPRPIKDVIRQLEKEEKALNSQKLPKSIFSASSHDGNTSKEEISEQYLKDNKDSFAKLIENVKRRRNEAKCGPENAAELENSSSVDYCQPSTSKSVTNLQADPPGPVGDPADWIDIEEMKVEDIKRERSSQRTENSDRDGEDDEIFFSNMKSPKRSKRKLFVGLKETPAYLMEEQVPNEEGSDDSVSILTNHCDEPIGVDDNDSDTDDFILSPVLKRSSARKRKSNKENAPQRNLRKRRK